MKRILKYFFLIIGIFVSLGLNAQQNNTLYFMRDIPQSNQLNPASPLKCGFYIGMPAFSSLELNAGNRALGFNDIFLYKKSIDSLVYFLYDNQSQSNFLSKLSKTNALFTNLNLDWFSIGWRMGSQYVSFNVGERIDASFNIPKDLVRFFMKFNLTTIDPNAPTQTFDLSGIGVDATWYRDVSINVSREVNKDFILGVRAKVLFGIANMSTTQSHMYLKDTGIEKWRIENNIVMNMSMPGVAVDQSGAKQNLSDLSFESSNVSLGSSLLNVKNMGLGADLGFFYRLNEKLSLSASLIDLGYIQWTDNVSRLNFDNAYDFRGVTFDYSNSDSSNFASALADSMKNVFSFSASKGSYTTYLSPKLYLATEWQLHKRIGLGALARFQYRNGEIDQQYTASLFINVFNNLSLSTSYTIADGMYDNFGLGFTYRLGPMQWYVLSERVSLFYNKISNMGTYFPAYAKNVNFRTGINFTFGHERNKKLLKDKPLVEE